MVHVPYPTPRGISAAAGLLSTVIDLAKYDAAIDRYKFLRQETQNQAWTPFASPRGERLPHGLGWFVEDYHGLRVIWHFGNFGPGFSATYLKVPEKHLSLILLANSESLSEGFFFTGGIGTSPFACSFLRLFVSEGLTGRMLPDPTWSKSASEFSSELSSLKNRTGGYAYGCELASYGAMMKRLEDSRAGRHRIARINKSTYDAYVGQYQLNANRTFIVSKDGNKLMIDIPRGEKSELFPESESKFFLKVRDVEITFVRDEKGQVSAMDIEAYEQIQQAKRIK